MQRTRKKRKWELVDCKLNTSGNGIQEKNKPKRERMWRMREKQKCREHDLQGGSGAPELLMPQRRWDAQQSSNTSSVCWREGGATCSLRWRAQRWAQTAARRRFRPTLEQIWTASRLEEQLSGRNLHQKTPQGLFPADFFLYFCKLLWASKLLVRGAISKGNTVLPQLQQIPPWINQAVGSEFPLSANPCPACSGYSCLSEISSRIMPWPLPLLP